MMLGRMIFDTKMFGEDSKYTTLINEYPESLQEDLQKAINHLSAKLIENREEGKPEIEEIINSIPADPTVKNFTYAVTEPNYLGAKRVTAIRYNSFTSAYAVTNKVYDITSRIRASESYGTRYARRDNNSMVILLNTY